ncbi:PP2C family protein-serine/threonine phosphatase [Yinghuangia seranimata]|uniref:PP2C family protein-serine/threonine phosphatase n=1 Tax=Yinghuangia seranimata TaxID=408067 RepID=UPI00248BAF7A|nr:PP2C family protein-serine/threonine phosphatase [Yinghuangia seranimata]MDI2127272.1 PP2C family protein-serine/threonine phosphatase [Yinghuangia seranimata]MDI2132217.1 PP2C family protein-serine/threonine phosphatase [Yinghuangia seranimata]
MSTKPRPAPLAGRLGRGPDSPYTAAWVWWAPYAVIVLDVVCEILLPRSWASGFVLVAVPVLAAITRPARLVAALTLVAVGLQLLFAWRFDHLSEVHHVGIYVATGIVGVISVELSVQRERDARQLVQARSVGEAVQLMLLRPIPAALGPVRAAGYYQAADTRAQVGGDLYDLCATPYGVRVLVGDVRGKGLAAIQHVGTVLGSFRDAAHEIPDLAELTDRMERRLAREAADAGDAELFVTALFLEFPPDAPEVRIADRGHPSPVLVRYGGAAKLPTRPGVPLGLGALGGAPTEVTRHPLAPGEVLVAHTDGVSEARGTDGEFYPLADRLAAHFGGCDVLDPGAVAGFVREDLAEYAVGTPDDVAVIALARAD